MRWLKRAALVLAVAAAAYLGWSSAAGPMQAKRQVHAFAAALADCAPLEQAVTYRLRGGVLRRAVLGASGGACGFELQALAPTPQFVVCAVPLERMPALAESFGRQADAIGHFGGLRVQIDIGAEDPLQVALNGPECRTESR